MDIRKVSLWIAGLSMLFAWKCVGATELINAETPWRVFLVCKTQDRHRKQPPKFTTAPPVAWTQTDFDDSGWGRYTSDLTRILGG
jgi:hypothetical protein